MWAGELLHNLKFGRGETAEFDSVAAILYHI